MIGPDPVALVAVAGSTERLAVVEPGGAVAAVRLLVVCVEPAVWSVAAWRGAAASGLDEERVSHPERKGAGVDAAFDDAIAGIEDVPAEGRDAEMAECGERMDRRAIDELAPAVAISERDRY